MRKDADGEENDECCLSLSKQACENVFTYANASKG